MRLSGARPDGLGAASGSRSSIRGRSPGGVQGPKMRCRPLVRSSALLFAAPERFVMVPEALPGTNHDPMHFDQCLYPSQTSTGTIRSARGAPWRPLGPPGGVDHHICINIPFKKIHAYIHEANADVVTCEITSSDPCLFFPDVLESSRCPANTARKKTQVLCMINPK